MNVKEVDIRLEELKASLEENKKRRTEVYSRIVGYYRSVQNWNKGKKEEFGIRRTFSTNCVPAKVNVPEALETKAVPEVDPVPVETESILTEEKISQDESPKTEKVVESMEPASEQGDLFGGTPSSENNMKYRFYFRQDCPNCPPMKAFVETLALKGEKVDVDQEEGLQLAIGDNVYTAPTVILFDDKKEEVFRTDNVSGLEEFLSQTKEAVIL